MTDRWFWWRDDTLYLAVRAQPGAKRSAVAGLHGGRLKIRVAAPPVDGKANAELCHFIGAEFGVAATHVALVSGHTSRDKQLSIARPKLEPAWLRDLGTG